MCNGQILPISQNAPLFSLVGTYYGGNGTNNFALPNLQTRAPLGMGQGPGLSNYTLGQFGGSASVTLSTSQIPSHSHALNCSSVGGNSFTPLSGIWSEGGLTRNQALYNPATGNPPLVAMHPQALSPAGGNVAHNNMPPYLTLNFCICLSGVYPSRS